MRLPVVLAAAVLLALFHPPLEALGATVAGSSSVALAWDGSTSVGVTGYRIYYGVTSGNYSNSVSVGKVTTNTVSGLANGILYYFAITAHDAGGVESLFSNEISFAPATPVILIRVTSAGQTVLTVNGLKGGVYDILATQTLQAWTVIGTVTLGVSGSVDFTDPAGASLPNRFYRTQQKP